MVQIDIPAAFIASQLLLDIGRKAVKKEAEGSSRGLPAVYYRFLFRSVFFAGFVIAPAGIYLLAGWPGWEQLYWTERVETVIFDWTNALLPALFVMAIVLAGYTGHVVGYRWLVTGREKYLRPTYLCLLAAVTLLVLFNYPAFTVVGTYAEYHSNPEAMPTAWGNPHDFVRGLILVMAYFAVSFLWLVVRTWKESRRA